MPVPGDHRNGRTVPSASWLVPMTCPLELMPVATLSSPPRVPRSVMAPVADQSTACLCPEAVVDEPAICPALLMATASLDDPPSVPRSRMPALDQTKACRFPL